MRKNKPEPFTDPHRVTAIWCNVIFTFVFAVADIKHLHNTPVSIHGDASFLLVPQCASLFRRGIIKLLHGDTRCGRQVLNRRVYVTMEVKKLSQDSVQMPKWENHWHRAGFLNVHLKKQSADFQSIQLCCRYPSASRLLRPSRQAGEEGQCSVWTND